MPEYYPRGCVAKCAQPVKEQLVARSNDEHITRHIHSEHTGVHVEGADKAWLTVIQTPPVNDPVLVGCRPIVVVYLVDE